MMCKSSNFVFLYQDCFALDIPGSIIIFKCGKYAKKTLVLK